MPKKSVLIGESIEIQTKVESKVTCTIQYIAVIHPYIILTRNWTTLNILCHSVSKDVELHCVGYYCIVLLNSFHVCSWTNVYLQCEYARLFTFVVTFVTLCPFCFACKIVHVWKMKTATVKGPTELNLKHTLHGHTGHVTCLAASSSFNLIVSGSKVRTIEWNLYWCLNTLWS